MRRKRIQNKCTALFIAIFILSSITTACDDGNKEKNNTANNTNNSNSQNCMFAGTYTIDSSEILTGACTLAMVDPSIRIRQAGAQVMMKFDSTDWKIASVQNCTFNANGPDGWWVNGVRRTRTMAVTVAGDVLTADVTDRLEGTDNLGNTCDVQVRIRATRTGPAPDGVGVGEDGCGPVGCSALLCAFGNEFDCADGFCLLDSTGDWMESYCTRPCAGPDDCPEGFDCVRAAENWDGAPAGKYCTRWRAVCGNGVPEEGEACDDGNTDDGDGCSADCQNVERCGNQRLEPGEECDAGAPGEWLSCSAQCRIELPADTTMPLGVGVSDILAAHADSAFLVVGYDSGIFAGDYEPKVRFARTTDAGQTWTSGLVPSSDCWLMPPAAIAVQGERVTVAFASSQGLRLSESTDGGQTWSPAAPVFVPEGATQDEYGIPTIAMRYGDDGALWLALSKPQAIVVLRREAPGQIIQKIGEMSLPPPPDSQGCRLNFKPFRFDLSNGAGVHLHYAPNGVRLTAGASCSGSNGYDHNLWSARFDASGPVGPAVDLVQTAGMGSTEEIFAAVVSPDWRHSPVVCLSEGQFANGRTRCGQVDESTGAWTFADTPAAPDSWNARGVAAVLGRPGHWVLVQDVAAESVMRIHRTLDAGLTWSHVDIPGTNFGNGKTLAPISDSAALLFEVDFNNEASFVRIDLSTFAAGEPAYLFGDARRADGSGLPWTFSSDSDGSGLALVAYSLPDSLRQWIHAVRFVQ